jgi:hypothetical protein
MKYKKVLGSSTDQRFFEDETGKLFVVDHSGTNPKNTDDGPLELLPMTELVSTRFGLASEGPVFDLPVYSHRDDDNFIAMCGLKQAEFLSKRLNVPVLIRVKKRDFILK